MHSVWMHWMHIEGHLICIQCGCTGCILRDIYYAFSVDALTWTHWMHIEGHLICIQCGRTGCILREI